MNINTGNTNMLYGLYGSHINRSRAVGYCKHHKAALTVKTLKCHNCLGKQCKALKKYEEHDFWRQHAQRKEWRKSRRENIAKRIYN